MDGISNYIIFHPKRQKVQAYATIINSCNKVIRNWKGNIFVDYVGVGNEDPFVFNNPWIYSYCHASQLRRTPRKGSYLKQGSVIIFVSGPDADNGLFTVDTIFVIDSVLEWGIKHLPLHIQDLPEKYHYLKDDKDSELWMRHFRFPFEGQHKNASYSYEAKLWNENSDNIQFSYLPLTEDQKPVSIPFSELPVSVMNILMQKRKGKIPAEINSESDINKVLNIIKSKTSIKVLRDIKYIKSCNTGNKKKGKNGCIIC